VATPRPNAAPASTAVLLRELGGQLGRDQHENDHPAGVHIDGYTEDPSDAKSWLIGILRLASRVTASVAAIFLQYTTSDSRQHQTDAPFP